MSQVQPSMWMLKAEAKRLRNSKGIKHSEALELIAKQMGFRDFNEAHKKLRTK